MKRDTALALLLVGIGGGLLVWNHRRKQPPALKISIGEAKLEPRMAADIDFLANSLYR